MHVRYRQAMTEIELAFLLIQYGLAFVFVWTGILILKDVPSWAKSLEESWAKKLLPASSESLIRATAVFDIVVGIWLFTGIALWVAALFAALHLTQVLLVRGIMGSEYRDVGLLAIAIALMLYSYPVTLT
jgi:uncharacterized membrane protein YphA (DoxX/SURF4 family)